MESLNGNIAGLIAVSANILIINNISTYAAGRGAAQWGRGLRRNAQTPRSAFCLLRSFVAKCLSFSSGFGHFASDSALFSNIFPHKHLSLIK